MKFFLKNAKRMVSIIILALLVTSCSLFHSFFVGYSDYYSTCFCYKGQWSAWQENYFSYAKISSHTAPNGDIIGVNLEDNGGNVYFKFIITDYEPGKKSCVGIVEYYVNDTYPTAEDIARAKQFVKPDYRYDTTPSVKRTTKATIKIVNNRRKPDTFNIWYDHIGVGISVANICWRKK